MKLLQTKLVYKFSGVLNWLRSMFTCRIPPKFEKMRGPVLLILYESLYSQSKLYLRLSQSLSKSKIFNYVYRFISARSLIEYKIPSMSRWHGQLVMKRMVPTFGRQPIVESIPSVVSATDLLQILCSSMKRIAPIRGSRDFYTAVQHTVLTVYISVWALRIGRAMHSRICDTILHGTSLQASSFVVLVQT